MTNRVNIRATDNPNAAPNFMRARKVATESSEEIRQAIADAVEAGNKKTFKFLLGIDIDSLDSLDSWHADRFFLRRLRENGKDWRQIGIGTLAAALAGSLGGWASGLFHGGGK